MKWIKRLVIATVVLVLVAFGGLLIAGQRPGAAHNEASVEIDRPASVVYRALVDPASLKQWSFGVVEVRPLNDLKGPGARERVIVNMHDERFEMDSEVLRLEPDRRIELKISSVGETDVHFTENVAYLLEETAGRTRVTVAGDSVYEGFFANLLEPIITPSAQEKLEGDLARLKQMLEAAPRETAGDAEALTGAPVPPPPSAASP